MLSKHYSTELFPQPFAFILRQGHTRLAKLASNSLCSPGYLKFAILLILLPEELTLEVYAITPSSFDNLNISFPIHQQMPQTFNRALKSVQNSALPLQLGHAAHPFSLPAWKMAVAASSVVSLLLFSFPVQNPEQLLIIWINYIIPLPHIFQWIYIFFRAKVNTVK